MCTAENLVLAGTYLRIFNVKGKGKDKIECKLVPVYAMKAYRGSRCENPLFRNPDARWRLRRCIGDSTNKWYYINILTTSCSAVSIRICLNKATTEDQTSNYKPRMQHKHKSNGIRKEYLM
jgi:hypothetical protein